MVTLSCKTPVHGGASDRRDCNQECVEESTSVYIICLFQTFFCDYRGYSKVDSQSDENNRVEVVFHKDRFSSDEKRAVLDDQPRDQTSDVHEKSNQISPCALHVFAVCNCLQSDAVYYKIQEEEWHKVKGCYQMLFIKSPDHHQPESEVRFEENIDNL